MGARARLAVVILMALVLPGAASAGVAFVFRGSSGAGKVTVAGFGVGGGLPLGGGEATPGWYEDPATLIVDVAPHGAQVFLDGRPLGTAGELVAQALPITLGPHVVQVQAPGYRTRAWQFYADGTFPVRVRAILALE